jgi:hypothetical protein
MTEETIFAAALDKREPADRAAYLDATCAADPALRRRVEALLRSHDEAESFLRRPAVEQVAGPAGPPMDGDTRTGPTQPDAELPPDFLEPSDEPGSTGRLGHYEVWEVIGRGGMGRCSRRSTPASTGWWRSR